MLYRVIGAAGSGKTEAMLAALEQAFRAGERCIWLAPEQQSVQAERAILERLGDGCNLTVEILNFERLPERIARDYGDLAVRYPDRGTLCALLSVLAVENRQKLSEYAACAENGDFIEGMLGLFGRLRSERISPQALTDALQNGLEDDGRLRGKLADISLLYRAYDAYFDETCRDPRDALTVLADTLAEKPFFRGKTVFVDGYYTFTGQEYALLGEILRQANAVYCSFTYDGRELFAAHESSAFRLSKYAGGQVQDIPVGAYRRSQSDELRFLEQYLWADETPTFEGRTGDVRLLCAETVFSEAEAVASEILRLVRGGMRYRDITVLARNAQQYAGVLDAVLRQNGIPFFFSQKDDLQTKPLFSFLCACLETVISDCSLPAMRRYLKSGYGVLTDAECDVLLRYAESWNIRGKAWYDGQPWTRNPDGYREGGMTEEQEALLAMVNTLRARFAPYLKALRESLTGKGTGGLMARDILTALYTHLEQVGAPERFVDSVNALAERGEAEQAAKDSRLWGLLAEIFERLAELCGDRPMTVRRMLGLLQLTVRQYALGSIPISQDSVTVGEAALARPERAKAIIVMGCNDGVFPAAAASDPLFDDLEAAALENAGLCVVEGKLTRLEAERFYFYAAVSAPSQTLLLTYPLAKVSGEELRPSPAILRIRALLPHLVPQNHGGDGAQALFSAENACALFWSLPEGDEREELRSLLAKKGLQPPPLQERLFEPTARVQYASDSLRVSPSGTERYRYCPFSYFGTYVLKLKEKKEHRFATNEIGSFLHKILEQFLRAHTVDGKFLPPASDAQLETEADAWMQAYFAEVMGESAVQSKRFLHTCRNLKKTLLLLLQNLCGEFSASDFVPVGFEVRIGMGKDSLPAPELHLPDGKSVKLCGTIDRVDQLDRDGVQYVRVVDYKTYGKDLHLEYARAYGLDEQMLLYLYAYCRAAEGETRPAGVLYSMAVLPFAEAFGGESDAELRERLEEKLERNGVILDDPEIALAMDRNASGKYLPASFAKDGNLKKGKGTLTRQEFDDLLQLLERQLCELAENVFAGNMDIRPLQLDVRHDACTYCAYRAACRYRSDGAD